MYTEQQIECLTNNELNENKAVFEATFRYFYFHNSHFQAMVATVEEFPPCPPEGVC